MSPRLWALLAFGVFLGVAGCTGGAVSSAGGTGGSGGVPAGAGVGDSCTSQACRAGLVCQSGVCAPGHSTKENNPCVIGAECQDGLQCLDGTCQPAGAGAQGDSCRGDGDCQSGLRCGLVGFSAQCIPDGTNGVGKTCTTSADCFAGLACQAGLCETPPPGSPTFGAPLWQGVTCSAASTGTVHAYFEVPGVKDPAGDYGDYFRLPFPNDILSMGGKLDLSGFPTPGNELLGFDPVQRYIDALEKNDQGWGTYPTVIFRFSGAIDYGSFQASGGSSPVNWVDITSGDPAYGRSEGLGWYYSGGPTHYVCDNWFGVRRPQGHPLVPGHTYAVWLTTAGVDSHSKPIERSLQLEKLLSDNATPTDPKLAQAYTAYQPFRAYLKDKSIDPATILNATVITAGNVRDPMASIAKTIDSLPAPTAKSWVKCGSGVKSPCPQADANDGRACGTGDPAYDEYQALVSLPIFQQGSEPYKDSGGGVTDQVARNEDVCMALTVPKGTMPANGWPLVVYAHGTGGSYRSHIRPEVAGALSNVTTPGGTVQFAVLGIDQVEHGPRRGSSTDSPNDLFFNFANPDAARGNPIQGAADQLSLAKFAASLDVTAAQSGGDAIKADPNAIVFFGHSQGSTEGSLALPYTDVYKAAVLSGNGASLMDALLNKTSPVNIKGALPFVLADFDSKGGLAGGADHPVLTLLQQWEDPADPLNFADAIARTPITGMTPKHVFQTYGLGDTYAPPVTLQTFAIAAGLEEADPDASVSTPDKIGNLQPKPVPLSGNVSIGGNPYTLAVREYAPPSGNDGHFVVFDVKNANGDAVRFLGMAAEGNVPQVGQ